MNSYGVAEGTRAGDVIILYRKSGICWIGPAVRLIESSLEEKQMVKRADSRMRFRRNYAMI